MGYIHESYNSIDQLLRTISERPVNKVFKNYERSSQTGSEKFTGTKSYKAAEELIQGGWSEPLKELKERTKELSVKSNVTTNRTRPRNSVVGYAPCVPAAILGLPESMIATDRVPSKIKAVTIVYSNSGPCRVKTDQFLKAGAVVLNIVNNLELQGYRVRLLCEFYSAKERTERVVGRVSVKDWRQPLDLKKIAFPIAHSSMLRRIGFKWIETVPGLTNYGWPSGYGDDLAACEGYDGVKQDYEKNGLLSENEYYISRKMIDEQKYDIDAVMKKAGMNL